MNLRLFYDFVLCNSALISMELHHIVLVYSLTEEHFECFEHLLITNKASMNIHVQVFM